MENQPRPPQPEAAQVEGEGKESPDDLKKLITESAATRPIPVNAHTYIRKWDNTSSKPVALKCDDGNVYVVKARQPANPGMHRVITNEQVVGRLGTLIHAGIPPITFVNVPDKLIAEQPEIKHMSAGVAHGSLYDNDLSECLGFVHLDVAGNRSRFAMFAVLYGWVVASDHQFFYRKPDPHLVYSVDHGYFFPGQQNWTAQSLNAAPRSRPDETIVKTCKLTDSDLHPAIRELSAIDKTALACTVALPPDDWGITMEERIVLLRFLMRRREELLSLLPAEKNQGGRV